MNAAEIAETLNNGNIALARQTIFYSHGGDVIRSNYEAATWALDVVNELAMLAPEYPDYQWALGKVRRCLEGGA